MNYLKDGACSLSNNLSENSIRPLVVGRKNWLFCDTPAGADASMKIYSMIETAKANELDPLKYLSFLLEHRPSAEMSDEELEQFAPWSKLAQETCKCSEILACLASWRRVSDFIYRVHPKTMRLPSMSNWYHCRYFVFYRKRLRYFQKP